MREKVKLTDLLNEKKSTTTVPVQSGKVKLTDLLEEQKKSPVTNEVVTPDLNKPVQQQLPLLEQNGLNKPITLPEESLRTGIPATENTAVIEVKEPAGYTTKEERKQNVGKKVIEQTVAKKQAIESLNKVRDNLEYPVMQEISTLYQQADEIQKAGGNPTEILSKIEELKKLPVSDEWRKPIQIQTGENTSYQIPAIKKSPYKTYGEMFDANVLDNQKAKQKVDEFHKLAAEIEPEVRSIRSEEGFEPNAVDEQGNPYYKMGPIESFAHGFVNGLETLSAGLKNIGGDKEGAIRDIKNKWAEDNVLFPKSTGDAGFSAEGAINAFSKGAEMVGAVTPMAVGAGLAAAGTGGLGGLAVNALLFGSQDYGNSLYQSFSEGKANGLTDEQAMEEAQKNAKFAGVKGAVLGVTLPIQGAIGRKMFLNGAESSAFKTFMAEQGVMAPVFGGSTALQNWYEGKPIKDNVGQSIVDAFVLGGIMHTLPIVKTLPEKTADLFTNALAKNFEPLKPIIEQAVKDGVVDFNTANEIATKAKAYDVMPKDLPAETEQKVVPLIEQKQQLEEQKKGLDKAFKTDVDEKINAIDEQIKTTVEEGKKTYNVGDVVELEPTVTENISEQPKTEQNAIQEQTTAEGVLRERGLRGEGELQGVERQNKSESVTQEGIANELEQTAQVEQPNETTPVEKREEISVTPEAKDNFAMITDLFYKIREASGSSKKRSLKEQRDKILEENPSIKYIDDNISSVMKQLEDKGLITKKGDCP